MKAHSICSRTVSGTVGPQSDLAGDVSHAPATTAGAYSKASKTRLPPNTASSSGSRRRTMAVMEVPGNGEWAASVSAPARSRSPGLPVAGKPAEPPAAGSSFSCSTSGWRMSARRLGQRAVGQHLGQRVAHAGIDQRRKLAAVRRPAGRPRRSRRTAPAHERATARRRRRRRAKRPGLADCELADAPPETVCFMSIFLFPFKRRTGARIARPSSANNAGRQRRRARACACMAPS